MKQQNGIDVAAAASRAYRQRELMDHACREVATCAERLARVSNTTVRLAILRGKEPAVVLKWVHDLHSANDALRDALEEVRDLQKQNRST